MFEVGEEVDRYVIEELLGKGGMAAVYRVRHSQLGSMHALKVLLISMPAVRRRLLSEGQVQARLRHPNLVAVTDVLEVDRAPALVMEYVEGPSLEEHVRDHELDLDAALALFKGVLLGVAAAHEAGVVHRDLKPANVLLEKTRRGFVPKVMDFGLVKAVDAEQGHTVSGATIGTPAYMAPEQIRDSSTVDARADLWALGCILYELTTGSRPFASEDPFDLYDAIRAASFLDPIELRADLPPRVVQAIHGLLQADVHARIGSCSDLHELLYGEPLEQDQDAVHLRMETPPPLRRRPDRKAEIGLLQSQIEELEVRRRRDRRVVGGAVLAGAPVVLLVVWLVIAWSRSAPETDGVATVDDPVPPSADDPRPPAPIAVPVPVAAPEPVPTATRPVSADGPRPVPVPVPARPTPVPAAQPVPPTPAPPAPEGGTVRVEGDAEDVWLELGGVRTDPGGPIAAGSYQVHARFADGTHTSSDLRLRAGDVITVRCTSFHFSCAAIRDPGVPAVP